MGRVFKLLLPFRFPRPRAYFTIVLSYASIWIDGEPAIKKFQVNQTPTVTHQIAR